MRRRGGGKGREEKRNRTGGRERERRGKGEVNEGIQRWRRKRRERRK